MCVCVWGGGDILSIEVQIRSSLFGRGRATKYMHLGKYLENNKLTGKIVPKGMLIGLSMRFLLEIFSKLGLV